MARARNIKPGFFRNGLLAECPMATRLDIGRPSAMMGHAGLVSRREDWP